jgi:penicillin-binding protein-related factor A (putative recombinase)
MHERDFMKKWVEDHLKDHPKDYWMRLPDSAEGTKPFDGVLLCGGKPIAIEFKVWRQKGKFSFSVVEPHQLRELLVWEKAGGVAWVLVLHERTGDVKVYYPKRKVLKALLKDKK